MRRIGGKTHLGLEGLLQPSEHPVQHAHEVRQLIRAGLLRKPLRKVALADLLGGPGNLVHGLQGLLRQEESTDADQQQGARRDRRDQPEELRQRGLERAERETHLEDLTHARGALDRKVENAHAAARDPARLDEDPPLPRGLQSPGTDGECRAGERRRRREEAPLGIDELNGAGGAVGQPLTVARSRSHRDIAAGRVEQRGRLRLRDGPQRAVDVLQEASRHARVEQRAGGEENGAHHHQVPERQPGSEGAKGRPHEGHEGKDRGSAGEPASRVRRPADRRPGAEESPRPQAELAMGRDQ